MNIFVFDIETVPDVTAGKKIYDLPDLDNETVANIMFNKQKQKTGSEFLPLYLQQIVCISIVLHSNNLLKVWSLGDTDATEKEIIQRFYEGIERFTPTLVSWNGTTFDLPVLHYRSLIHDIVAERYWENGNNDNQFKWNNYTNRYHERHTDLMDVLAGFQGRANAPLDKIATLCGFPGKMGMSGDKVWETFHAGDIEAIRNYCETDVLNTYLVYLKFERMRGKLIPNAYDESLKNLQAYLENERKPHFDEFLQHWNH